MVIAGGIVIIGNNFTMILNSMPQPYRLWFSLLLIFLSLVFMAILLKDLLKK